MMPTKTQDEIDAIAERIRSAGLPDSQNRWLGMTPEKLAASEQLVARQAAEDRNRRSTTMPKPKGPKEQQVAALREGAAEAKKSKPGAKTKTKKESTAKARTPVVQDTGTTPTAIRPGSKMETIKKLLARKNGCTAKEVMTACEWPSVSMPQQAKALGIELHKFKDEEGVTRYADHPLN